MISLDDMIIGSTVANETVAKVEQPTALAIQPVDTLPNEDECNQLLIQYHKAVSGLYEAWKFGQMLAKVEDAVTGVLARENARETQNSNGGVLADGGWNAGSGLKPWLAQHCPDISYKTAMKFKAIFVKTAQALPEEAQNDEAQVMAYLDGKSQRSILRGGKREGAGRKSKLPDLDDGHAAWITLEPALNTLMDVVVMRKLYQKLQADDLDVLRSVVAQLSVALSL